MSALLGGASLDVSVVARWQRPVGGHVVFVLDAATSAKLANVTAYDATGQRLGGSGIIVAASP